MESENALQIFVLSRFRTENRCPLFLKTLYRVIAYFGGRDIPVFLLNVFAKGERANLSKAERNELRKVLGELADAYRSGVKRDVEGR